MTAEFYNERRTEMSEENKLITYRLDQLEKNLVTKVDSLHDIVLKLNTKLDAGAFSTMNCPIQAGRITVIEKELEETKKDIDVFKAWTKWIGGVVATIIFIWTVINSPIVDKYLMSNDRKPVPVLVDKK